MNTLSRFKDKTLLIRLENYDNKYYEAIMTPRKEQQWGYAMRAYHASKVANPPEWKIKDKARAINEELQRRGVQYHTHYLKL